jgi:hypothetical protein
MRAAIGVAGLALALIAPGAAACGYCVEDKIASTYDHAVVTQALAQKHQVAFFHLDGPVAPGAESSKVLAALAEKTSGIDKGTVRVVAETLTISFAFDPRRAPLAAVQSAMEKRLAPKKLSLMPLRIIDSPAELKAIETYKAKQSKPYL